MAQEPDEITRPIQQAAQTASAASSSSTDEIRAQIHATRAEMSQTIDAIQERLSPGHLMTHTKETVKDATVGRAKQLMQRASRATADFASHSFEDPGRVAQRLKANPIPLAAVGVAATWLAVRALRRRPANAIDRGIHVEAGRTRRRLTAIGRVRQKGRLLIGVGSGMAFWGIWKTRHPMPARRLHRHPDEATRPLSEPIGSLPR